MLVFAAMLEFGVVNTLARKEIRKLSVKAKDTKDDTADVVRTVCFVILIHSLLGSIKLILSSNFWKLKFSAFCETAIRNATKSRLSQLYENKLYESKLYK